MEIHGKFIDSLTVRALVRNKRKYEKFIESFLDVTFSSSKYATVDFLGARFKATQNLNEVDGRPIKLRNDCITLGFMKKVPVKIARSPMIIKIKQPLVWKNPLQTLRQFKKDLEFYTGELELQIETIDVSVHYSGWLLDHHFASSFRTTSSNVWVNLKAQSVRIGSQNEDSIFMRLYNKSRFLRQHPKKPSPECLYVNKPLLGTDIWNLEFSYNSRVLKDGFGISDPEEVFKAIPILWAHATKDFVVVTTGPTSNLVHEHWEILSEAISSTSPEYFRRKSRRRADPNFEYRKEQVLKAMQSFSALTENDLTKYLTAEFLKAADLK